MDERALLFGVAAGPGSPAGKGVSGGFGRGGSRVPEVWTKAWMSMSTVSGSVQFHSTLLHLAPEGRFRIWRSGDRSAAGLTRNEIGVPRLFYFPITQIIQSSHELGDHRTRLGVMREMQTLVG